jgi:hypothetical protein
VRQEQPYEKPEPRDGIIKTKPVIKSLGEAAFENILNKNCGKHRVHEKPGMMAVIVDITDTVMLHMYEYEDDIQVHQGGEINIFKEAKTRMLKTNKTNPKHKNVNVNVDIINAVKFNKEYKADIQVHRDREINMFKEAKTRMLKTNPKGRNNAAIPIKTRLLYNGNYHQYSTSMSWF